MPKSSKPPAYRLHKASGQAVVTINKQDHYLGPHGSAKSREAYARLLGKQATTAQEAREAVPAPLAALSVAELLNAFWEHAKAYYVDREGKASREQLS